METVLGDIKTFLLWKIRICLDYLFNLNVLLLPPNATGSDKSTSKIQINSQEGSGEKWFVATACKIIYLLGVTSLLLSFPPVVAFIWTKVEEFDSQSTLTLTLLTGQVDIPS